MKLLEPILSNPLQPSVGPDYCPPPIDDILPAEEPLKENLWSFEFSWTQIKETFCTVEQLYAAIQDLYDSIREIKESYRELAATFPDLKIESNSGRGVSGSYFLIDEEGKRHFVIKPLDEDVGCIHSDGYATPFYSNPLRKNIPLYRSSMREVLAYQVALSIGVESVVPKTTLGIFKSDQFHDFADGINHSELKRFFEHCPSADKEKLCSAQEYVQNSKQLMEALQDFQMQSLSDEEIASRFDQRDFEDANILIWTTYDTDGHGGNILVYPKGTDEIGNEILGLKKIDNGLAFPEKNQALRNSLAYMPNAKLALSEEGKAKIAAIDIEALAKQFEEMDLEGAIPALRERIAHLKTLAKEPEITIKDINKAISKIGKKS